MGSRNFRYRFGENLPGTSSVTASKTPGFQPELYFTALPRQVSNAGDRRCGGSENAYRRQGNAGIVRCEHSAETGRPHARCYRALRPDLARLLANGSGEVPLQVELKTIHGTIVLGYFSLTDLHRKCGRSQFRRANSDRESSRATAYPRSGITDTSPGDVITTLFFEPGTPFVTPLTRASRENRETACASVDVQETLYASGNELGAFFQSAIFCSRCENVARTP